MRVALDTNILVYSEQLYRPEDKGKAEASRTLIRRLLRDSVRPLLPAQALIEFVEVARRRFAAPMSDLARRTRAIARLYEVRSSSPATFDDALTLVERHGLRIFDAVIVATAAEAGCDLLLSEDMHDGFVWRGVEISNPFRASPDPRLAPYLGAPP